MEERFGIRPGAKIGRLVGCGLLLGLVTWSFLDMLGSDRRSTATIVLAAAAILIVLRFDLPRLLLWSARISGNTLVVRAGHLLGSKVIPLDQVVLAESTRRISIRGRERAISQSHHFAIATKRQTVRIVLADVQGADRLIELVTTRAGLVKTKEAPAHVRWERPGAQGSVTAEGGGR